jgi:hypothetical protein
VYPPKIETTIIKYSKNNTNISDTENMSRLPITIGFLESQALFCKCSNQNLLIHYEIVSPYNGLAE